MFYKCFLALFATSLLFFTGCQEEVIGTVVNSETAVVKQGSKYHNVAIVTFKTDDGKTKVYCDPGYNSRRRGCWDKGERHILTFLHESANVGGYAAIGDVRKPAGRLVGGENLIELDGKEQGIPNHSAYDPGSIQDQLKKIRQDISSYNRVRINDMETMENLVHQLLAEQKETQKKLNYAFGPNLETKVNAQTVSTNVHDDD